MGFPTGASTITLTGTFPVPVGGAARTGRVVFTPSARLVDATQKAIYSGGGSAALDTAGHFSVVLLCTDDADVQPAGWRWQVDEQPSGGPRRRYWIDQPSTLGTSADLAELAEVDAPDGSPGDPPTAHPVGPAGGALTGAYPNPQLAAEVIASFDPTGAAASVQEAAAADATTKANTAQSAATTAAAADASAKVAAHAAASDPHGDRAAASAALSAHEADTTSVHGITDTAALETQTGAQGKADAAQSAAITAAASDATAKVSAHVAAVDPHGDRAYTDATLALKADKAGATFTGNVAVNGADLSVLGIGKGYRLRRGGSSLDLEATGADLLVSNWSGTSFDGTQRSYLRLSADAQNVQIAGRVEFVDALYGTVKHTLDPGAGATISGDASVSGRLSGPVAPYGVVAPSRTSPAWRKASISHIFQSGHGWTANGAASSNLNNTASFVRGTQCASITTNTSGGAANLRRFGMSAMDLTGKMFRLICRVDDVTKVSDINVFAGTSSLANNFKWRLWEISGTSQLGSSGEWLTLTFGWSSLNSASGSYSISSAGVPSTTAGFTDLEVQAIATNGNAITLDVQALEVIDGTAATFPNGVVSIVFDDGADSIWNLARPAMDTYGYQGTNYVIVGNLGSTNYMTTAQSRSLQDFSGWDIGLHSYDATVHNNRYSTYTAAQVDDDIRLGKQWLVQNGLRGEAIAYPGGEYQTTTDGVGIDSIASRYFSTGRTILFQTGYPTETFPAGMPMRMRAVSSISDTQSGANKPSNLVATGGLLDKCQLNSGWLVLVFHKITVGAATVSTECSQSDFQLIMAGINSRGIPVVPVSDVYRLYS